PPTAGGGAATAPSVTGPGPANAGAPATDCHHHIGRRRSSDRRGHVFLIETVGDGRGSAVDPSVPHLPRGLVIRAGRLDDGTFEGGPEPSVKCCGSGHTGSWYY